jgi:hypothetical protein
MISPSLIEAHLDIIRALGSRTRPVDRAARRGALRRRRVAAENELTAPITIRPAARCDADAIARLAQLDGHGLPKGRRGERADRADHHPSGRALRRGRDRPPRPAGRPRPAEGPPPRRRVGRPDLGRRGDRFGPHRGRPVRADRRGRPARRAARSAASQRRAAARRLSYDGSGISPSPVNSSPASGNERSAGGKMWSEALRSSSARRSPLVRTN